MDKKLASVIKYFAFFGYFPSFDDVYTFFPIKISKKRLKTIYEAKKYTVGEYSIKQSQMSKLKSQISKKKLSNWRFRAYVKLINLFPQIKLVGLSGSISMMNAGPEDDIDLFIITARKKLFTGRFIALVLAQLLGLRRKREQDVIASDRRERGNLKKEIASSSLTPRNDKVADKVCLNLFFDEKNLKVPRFKQTLFVGHEVLQMKPVINKNYTYERFLEANKWVFGLFPNSVPPVISSGARNLAKRNKLGDWLENLLKNLQLKLINQHKTTEIVTNTQLWFHPIDFEKKIKL